MEKKEKINIPDKAATHGGMFHADDVFSAVFLEMANPNIKIERVFRLPENYNRLAFDIGLGKFDHHQMDNEIRENGVPYAAFGKLWKEYGPHFFNQEIVERIDEEFVQQLDLSDNTGTPNRICESIGSIVPTWHENKSMDEAFNEAKNFAYDILTNEIMYQIGEKTIEERNVELEKLLTSDFMIERQEKYNEAKRLSEEILNPAINNMQNGVVVTDRYCEWEEKLTNTEGANIFVCPSIRGGYNVLLVPSPDATPEDMAKKVYFPEEWLGKQNPDLGITFCHPGNFIACTETLEQAVNVANITVDRWREQELEHDAEELTLS